MTFRQLNQSYLIPAMQTVMIFGIVALCQPWSDFLHRYGLLILILGLVGFIITSHIGPEQEEEDFIEESLDILELNEPGTNHDPTSPASSGRGNA